MQPNSLNILPWYSDLKYQNHRLKYYAYGQIFRLQVEQNQIPPFQFVRPGISGADIFTFTLTEINTGAVTDVTSAVKSAGLNIVTDVAGNYDLIIYPSKSILPTSLLPYGLYYCTMTDTNGSTWYSEVFAMVQSLAGMVRIEYSHDGDFCYAGGHIDYGNNFKNYVNLKTVLGKPSYEYQEEVEERNGYNFPIQQISYKLFRFEFKAPEYLIDALRVIRMHDFVKVIWEGVEYQVDEFLMEPEWMEWGDIANVVCEFKTDTVVSVNGRGVTDATGEPAAGSCTNADYLPVAYIVENSPEYNSRYYTDPVTFFANNINAGDLVLVEDEITGTVQLFEWDGLAYNLQATSVGESAQDQNTGAYYWRYYNNNEFRTIQIDAIVNTDSSGIKQDPKVWTVYGYGLTTLTDLIVEIYTVDEDGNEALAGVGTGDQMDAPGIEFAWNAAAVGILARVSNAACEDFVETSVTNFEGVNYWTLETEFEVQ